MHFCLKKASSTRTAISSRHDHAYIVGAKLEHTGLPWNKLVGYMEQLVAFIQQDSSINDP